MYFITPHVQVSSTSLQAQRRSGIDLSRIPIIFEDPTAVFYFEFRILEEFILSTPQNTMKTMLKFEAIVDLRKGTYNENAEFCLK